MPTIAFRIEVHQASTRMLERWGPGLPSRPHWRLYWNDRPGARVWVGRLSAALNPDKLVLIQPRTPIRRKLDNPVSHHNIHFSLGLPWDLVRGSVFSLDAPSGVADILSLAAPLRAGIAGHFAMSELIMGCFRQLPTSVFAGFVFDERVTETIAHMEDHRERRIQNAELAELAHMTTNAFIRLFTRQTGSSPQAFYLQMRLDHAAILLIRRSLLTVEQIADATGFHDRHHFARAFNGRYGRSPSAYRRLSDT